MKTLTFLTLLLITSSSAVGLMMQSNQTSFVGKDVLLSCNCSNDLKELVWQKGERIVNLHPTNKSLINDSYKDRTQLFLNNEKRNCSLLIRNISTEDAGVYTCHALTSLENSFWSMKSSEVNLTVSEKESVSEGVSAGKSVSAVSAVSVGVPIFVIVLLLVVGLFLTITIRRRHRTSTNTGSEEPMLEKL